MRCSVYFLLNWLFFVSFCHLVLASPGKYCAYRCRNGECISLDKVCDGTAHCLDGSDEVESVCGNIMCPGYAFRCDYGACVDDTAVCDGKQDCVDGSDEQKLICAAQMLQGNCDKWEVRCNSGQCVPYSKLCDTQVDCRDGDDDTILLCDDIERQTTTKRNSVTYFLEEQHKNSYKTHNSSRNSTMSVITEKYPKILAASELLSTTGCYIPNLPNLIIKNGREQVLVAGKYVPNGNFIYYFCQAQHSLKGFEANICKDTRWLYDFPYCEEPLEFGVTLVIIIFSVVCIVLLILIFRVRRVSPPTHPNTDRIWLVEREATPTAPIADNSILITDSPIPNRGVSTSTVPETPPPAYQLGM